MFISSKKLSISYLNAHPSLSDAGQINLERRLELIADFELEEIASVSDLKASADLLIVRIGLYEEDETLRWLKAFVSKMSKPNYVWTPSLIIAEAIQISEVNELFKYACGQNYYFDILTDKNLNDLAIRSANLIRFHQHLQELKRYQEQVVDLESKVKKIEGELERA